MRERDSGASIPETASLGRAAGAAIRWRGAGLVGSKTLGMLRSVVLAWLLLPDDFGLFAIAILPLDMLLGATDVGMLLALVQKRDLDARDLDVAWTVGVLRALLVCLVLVAFAPFVAALLGDARATNIIRLIALRPLIAALASIRLAQLERDLQFRSLAAVDLVSAAVQTILTLSLAASLGVWAMVAGLLGGAIAGVLTSYWQAPYRPRIIFDRGRASTLLRFGRWVLIASVVAMFGEGLLVAAITRLAGTAELGRYALAASIALTPAAMVGSLISGVAFATHARVVADDLQVARVFRSSIVAMMVLVVPAYAMLFVLAPTFVARTLDARWAGLSPVIRILAGAGVAGLVLDGTTAMLGGGGRPRASALLVLTFATVVGLTAWTLTSRFGIQGAAAARVAADVATVIVAALVARSVVRISVRGLVLPCVVVLIASSAGAIAARLSIPYSPAAWWLVLSGGVGVTCVAVTLFGLDHWLGGGIRRDAIYVLSRRHGSA